MSQTDAVRLTRLPNGLTVVSETMPRVETVSLGAYVGAGTRHEPADVNGVSHFLEHMAFKGTARRDAAAIAREIENVGGHLNAYTAREQTAFYAKVLKEDTALAVDIIGDILTHSTFIARGAGARARRDPAGDRPGQRHARRHRLRPFPGDGASRPRRWAAPCSAPRTTIKAMSREALTGYMRGHYGPKAHGGGRRRRAGARRRCSTWCARISPTCRRPAPPRPRPRATAAANSARRANWTRCTSCSASRRVQHGDPMHYPTQLLSTLLGGGMSSRLFQEIREKRGLVYSIYSFASPFRDGGLFQIYAGTGEKEAGELMPVTIEALRARAARRDRG